MGRERERKENKGESSDKRNRLIRTWGGKKKRAEKAVRYIKCRPINSQFSIFRPTKVKQMQEGEREKTHPSHLPVTYDSINGWENYDKRFFFLSLDSRRDFSPQKEKKWRRIDP